jgi:hypothetical protein
MRTTLSHDIVPPIDQHSIRAQCKTYITKRTLNVLGLWLAHFRLVRSVRLDQCQSVSSTICDKVNHCLTIVTELGRRWKIGLILSSTLPRIRSTQLFLLLYLSCYRIRNDLFYYECRKIN